MKLTGDARLRYEYQDNTLENDDSWTFRVRLRANAQVNDRTKVTYGISSDNQSFGDDNAASSGEKDNGRSNAYTDLANVDYNFGGNNWDLLVGRYEYKLGGANSYAYQYQDTFDGAQLQYTNDHFRATAGYGKFKEGSTKYDNALLGAKTAYGELEGFWNTGAVGVYYNNFDAAENRKTADDLWGAYLKQGFGKNWTAFVNYEKLTTAMLVITRKTMLTFGLVSSSTARLLSLLRNPGMLGLNTSTLKTALSLAGL